MKQTVTALFFLLFLAACAHEPPLADDEVVTAVPTTIIETAPTVQTPPPAAPIVTLATIVSETAVPDFDPLGASDHSAVAPTRDPGAKLDDLIALIQEKLDGHCVSCLHNVMGDEFLLSFYPAGVFTEDKKHALNLMSAVFLPLKGTITFSDTAAIGLLPDGVTPEDLYAGPQPLTAVLYSAGWGLTDSGKGLLFIIEENGGYRWAGLTVAADNFAPLPDLATIAPPPGLVYRLDNGWWQVRPDEHQKLSQHEGPLSLNPSATRALYAESGASSLLLIRFQEGEATTIPVGGTLFHGSEEIPWLDEDTAVLIVGPPGKPVLQASVGHLALLDILTGNVTLLEPELSIYSHPSVSLPDTIVYGGFDGLGVWPDEQAGSFSPAFLASNLSSVVFSSDGTKLAGVGSSEDGRYTFAYHVYDVANQTDISVHGVRPPGTDAVLPWGITWSPDSQWLALEPPSDDPIESGVWLAAADGSREIHLGIGTNHPVWLDGERLMFAATISGQTRIQLYDLKTGERFWLDTPVGAQPVQAAPEYLIYWRHWRQAEGNIIVCQQLWVYESGQVKARTCLTNDTRPMKLTTLSSEQLAQLQGWITAFRTLQISDQYPSYYGDRLLFVGRGTEYMTSYAQDWELVAFARALAGQLGIYRELPNEVEVTHPADSE